MSVSSSLRGCTYKYWQISLQLCDRERFIPHARHKLSRRLNIVVWLLSVGFNVKKAPYSYFSHNGFNPGCVMVYTGVVSLASFTVCEPVNILTFKRTFICESPQSLADVNGARWLYIWSTTSFSDSACPPFTIPTKSKNSDRLSRIHDHVFGGYRIGIIYG